MRDEVTWHVVAKYFRSLCAWISSGDFSVLHQDTTSLSTSVPKYGRSELGLKVTINDITLLAHN